MPDTRRIYTDPRIASRADRRVPPRCFPSLLWLAHVDFGSRDAPLGASGRGVPLERALQGAMAFITGIPLVLLPWIA